MSRRLIVPATDRQRIIRPLDPRAVQQLRAGSIHLAGVGVRSLGGGNTAWDSLADQANSFIDTNAPHKPRAARAPNGAAIWDLAGAGNTACWSIMAPGTALQWTQRGSIAVWARCKLTTAQVYLWNHGPEGYGGQLGSDNRALNNRVTFWYNPRDEVADLAHVKYSATISFYGSSADTLNYLHDGRDLPGRAKWNEDPAAVDPRQWHFYRIHYDATADNYASGGADLSRRLRFYVDEVELVGTGFSAPTNDAVYSYPINDGSTSNEINYRAAANGGPAQLFAPYYGLPPSSAPLTLGAQNYAGNGGFGSWPGEVSHALNANEEDANGGPMTATQWRGVMEFLRPA